MRNLWFGLVLLACGGCDFIGGAETLVRGSNNFIANDASADVVAHELARFDNVPAVTDEELLTIYATIHAKALEGDLDAARVLLRLASIQRAPPMEADQDE